MEIEQRVYSLIYYMEDGTFKMYILRGLYSVQTYKQERIRWIYFLLFSLFTDSQVQPLGIQEHWSLQLTVNMTIRNHSIAILSLQRCIIFSWNHDQTDWTRKCQNFKHFECLYEWILKFRTRYIKKQQQEVVGIKNLSQNHHTYFYRQINRKQIYSFRIETESTEESSQDKNKEWAKYTNNI